MLFLREGEARVKKEKRRLQCQKGKEHQSLLGRPRWHSQGERGGRRLERRKKR